jgi:hypothetical protein
MKARSRPAFRGVLAGFLLFGAAMFPADAAATGDTLTVIQRPLLNIPAIVADGGTFTVECEAGSGTTGWGAEIIHELTQVTLSILSSTYNSSTLWWEIEVQVPPVPVYGLYDLVVTANGGIEDTTRNAVRVIPSLKDDYYFIHITDTHLPTHLYYYEDGADTDSSEMVDLREIIGDVNIINPEFVLLTGDFINEGELEDFLNKRYFTRCQALLTEFEVPVYLTSGEQPPSRRALVHAELLVRLRARSLHRSGGLYQL